MRTRILKKTKVEKRERAEREALLRITLVRRNPDLVGPWHCCSQWGPPTRARAGSPRHRTRAGLQTIVR